MSENPPAFPSGGLAGYELARGMPLRDWFAGQALAGATTTITGIGDCTPMERGMMLSQLASLIYEIADAMLAARSAS